MVFHTAIINSLVPMRAIFVIISHPLGCTNGGGDMPLFEGTTSRYSFSRKLRNESFEIYDNKY
jgi:hypothetical protein